MDDLTWNERRSLARIEERLTREDPAFVRRVKAISGLAPQAPVRPGPARDLAGWISSHRVVSVLIAIMVTVLLLLAVMTA